MFFGRPLSSFIFKAYKRKILSSKQALVCPKTCKNGQQILKNLKIWNMFWQREITCRKNGLDSTLFYAYNDHHHSPKEQLKSKSYQNFIWKLTKAPKSCQKVPANRHLRSQNLTFTATAFGSAKTPVHYEPAPQSQPELAAVRRHPHHDVSCQCHPGADVSC